MAALELVYYGEMVRTEQLLQRDNYGISSWINIFIVTKSLNSIISMNTYRTLFARQKTIL